MKVKNESEVTRLCLTLSDPMDCSLPGSSVHGIYQPRVLKWGDPGSIPGSGRSPGKGTGCPFQYPWASLVAQLVKNPPAMRETWVWSLGWEDPLEKGKTTHSSILAWRIPWTMQSMGITKSQAGLDDFHFRLWATAVITALSPTIRLVNTWPIVEQRLWLSFAILCRGLGSSFSSQWRWLLAKAEEVACSTL